MILRRIKAHVENENWFAVGIDFCIVVIGVFIGIQVANWNEARVDAIAERAILERFRADVSEFQADAAMISTLYFQARQDNLISARRALFGVEDRTALTDGECEAIGLSHFPLIGVTALPILQELKATGQMALIRDREVVRAISKVGEIFDSGEALEISNRSKVTIPSLAFPNLITMELEEKDKDHPSVVQSDGYQAVYRCDFDGMRANPAFQNAFGENVNAQFFLLEASIEPGRQALTELSEALDRALGYETRGGGTS